MKTPIKIAITGAAGQIGYSILFRIASGDMLGYDQPIILQLLDIEPAKLVLKGVLMELEDCAFPLLQKVTISHDPYEAFEDIDIAILIGAKPRSKGMERRDLLETNGAIFTQQGQALNKVAKKTVKVLVVGNPANTNTLIALCNAKDLTPQNFSSMMLLDHNRAINQLAIKTEYPITDISKIIIWGNHSTTQYPDISHAYIGNKIATSLVDENWIINDFIPTVQKRGAKVIEARGLSSAASAANAAIYHIRNWVLGTNPNDWITMGVLSDGSYDIPSGVIYGFPVTCKNGNFEIVKNLPINSFSNQYMQLSYEELQEEKRLISKLLG